MDLNVGTLSPTRSAFPFSGDTFYDKFCQAVDDFEAQFEKTGATKGAVGVKVDLNPEEEDKVAIDVFTAAIAQHFQ